MKRTKLFLTLAAACVLLAASCGKDDEEKTLASNVAGNYSGSLNAWVMQTEAGEQEASLAIKAEGETTVKIDLPEYTYGTHGSYGGFEWAGVEVAEEGDGYSLFGIVYGESRNDTLMGTLVGDRLVLDYYVMPGSIPHAMHFRFEGSR